MKQTKILIAVLLLFSFIQTYHTLAQGGSFFSSLTPNAQLMERKVKIIWITPVAYKTSSFVIQKSSNDTDFEDIGKADARFDNQKRVMYAMYDEDISLADAKSYYRIIEFKDDGTSKPTESVVINNQVSTVVASNVSSKIIVEKSGLLDQIRIKGAVDFKLAQVMLAKDQSELGYVCTVEKGKDEDDEMILKPMYQLEAGDYVIKVKDANGTKKYKFTIRDTDIALN